MVAALASFPPDGYTSAVVHPIEDVVLVQAMAAGDREALAELYRRYASVMLGVGCRILRDRAEAEEVAHEVWVEAFHAARAYEAGRGSPRTWLLVRMRSRSLDRVKSAGRSRRCGLDELEPHRLIAPAAGLSGDERRLAEALVALPPDQRVVLELAYFDGLSSTEIATRLGVPVGTVKSRTAAALGKLRGALGAA